ncbi:MAG: Rpn family recombination-promoting nuclease/putative transposase [Eubacterium sp.]
MNTENYTDLPVLPVTNDFMFARIMENEEICKALLEAILNIHIKEIHYLETQKTMDLNLAIHGIRLDIYVEDDHQVYNIEMQTTSNKNLAKRCRYYQSNIDMDLLKKGEDYYSLKKSYVIFICTFDPFDLGLYQYTFENFCLENKTLPLDDGTTKIFLNTKGQTGAISENLLQILDYLKTQKPNPNPLVKKLEQAVQTANKDKEWRREMMTLEMKLNDKYREGKIEGKLEGELEGKIKGQFEEKQAIAKRMLKQNHPITFVAEITNLDEDKVRELLKSM